ncbi:UNVERIFIED_CONTAM: Astrotactin-2 [Gekko kuhli]
MQILTKPSVALGWSRTLTKLDSEDGESLSFADDLLSGLGTACVAAGRSHGDAPDISLYSVIFKCLEPDGLYK